uniref:Aminotransferase class V-fold PLP-dependent enzyme n=1 Tax=candidate division WOR-3 bacterium TaxID=2052148 RepID=A0A7C3UQE0_UNCW3
MDKMMLRYRKEFPVLQEKIYLNAAGSAPMPIRTKKAIESFLNRYVEEGNIPWEDCEKVSEETRSAVAQFLSCQPEEICFLRNTSEGIITVLALLDLKPTDNLILAIDSFPANLYPFLYSFPEVEKRFVRVLDGDLLGQIAKKVNRKTKLISLDWVHFLSGYPLDLKALSRFCRERGIYLLIDAIQGLGALPLNLKDLEIDFLTSGAGKWLFPPQGIGILYIRKETLPKLKPHHLGWLSCAWKNFNRVLQRKKLKNSASRYEEGTKNYLGIVGLRENIKMLSELGIENIGQYLLSLTDKLVSHLKEIDAKILPRGPGSGIVAFRKKGLSGEKLFSFLTERGFVVSLREDYIRCSPHFYNTEEEILSLIKELKKA